MLIEGKLTQPVYMYPGWVMGCLGKLNSSPELKPCRCMYNPTWVWPIPCLLTVDQSVNPGGGCQPEEQHPFIQFFIHSFISFTLSFKEHTMAYIKLKYFYMLFTVDAITFIQSIFFPLCTNVMYVLLEIIYERGIKFWKLISQVPLFKNAKWLKLHLAYVLRWNRGKNIYFFSHI